MIPSTIEAWRQVLESARDEQGVEDRVYLTLRDKLMLITSTSKCQTPIFKAICCGDLIILQLIDEFKCYNKDDKQFKGRNALHMACCMIYKDKRKSTYIVKFLVNQLGFNVNVQDEKGLSPLHWAVKSNSCEAVVALIELGANIHITTLSGGCDSRLLQGLSPIHYAKNEDIAVALITAGANVNTSNEFGTTPLHTASHFCFEDVVRLLIQYKAKINAKTKRGSTPLHLAGTARIVKALIHAGACFEARDMRGWTPLHCSSYYGLISVVKILLRYVDDVDCKDTSCRTPLHLAANPDIARLLLDEGADEDEISRRGGPIHSAIRSCNVGVVRVLLEYNCDINQKDNRENTPLHLVSYCINGILHCQDNNVRIEIAKLLIANSPDFTLRDRKERTPIEVCKREDPVFDLIIGAMKYQEDFDKEAASANLESVT